MKTIYTQLSLILGIFTMLPAFSQPYQGNQPINGGYEMGITGINNEMGNLISSASSAGLIINEVDFLKSQFDYLSFGHRISENSITDSLLPGSMRGMGSHWKREWYLDVTDDQANGGFVELIFNLNEGGFGGTTTTGSISDYKLMFRPNHNTPEYEDLSVLVSSITSATVSFYIEIGPNQNNLKDGIYTLGTINTTNSPLPVELTTFKGKFLTEGAIVLNWITASEKNSDRFFIERSSNGQTFSVIGDVISAGNSSTTRQYSFIDQKPEAGTNFYRLRQVDYDGSFEYSDVIAVYMDNSSEVEVESTILQNLLGVLLQTKAATNYNISLVSLTGKTCISTAYFLPAGDHRVELPVGDLKSGHYVLRVNNKTFRLVKP